MLINIQLLRFIAALAVVFTHAHPHVVANQGPEQGLFYYIAQFGYAGVDVFFVISGFIIWHTTQHINKNAEIASFIYKRATRIYTGYWPYFLLACVFFALTSPSIFDRVNLLGSFWLYSYRISDLLLPVSWSLTYELYFYSVFSILLLLDTQSRAKAIIGIFISITLFQIWVTANTNTYTAEHYRDASDLIRFYASPFCLEFLSGCLVGVFYQRINGKWWISLTAALALVLTALYIQNHVIQDGLMKGYHRMWRVSLFGTAAFFLVLSFLQMEKSGLVFQEKTSIYLGNISYSLYLSHTLLLAYFAYIGLNTYATEFIQIELWFTLISVVIVAYSSIHYMYIERTFRIWTLKIIQKNRKEPIKNHY